MRIQVSEVPGRGPKGGFVEHLRNTNGNTNLYSLPSLYRGIYNRVARRLGCDPSYVSRVARGERSSRAVAKALEIEIQHVMKLVARNGAAKPRTKPYSR